jgi:hypothetical protein
MFLNFILPHDNQEQRTEGVELETTKHGAGSSSSSDVDGAGSKTVDNELYQKAERTRGTGGDQGVNEGRGADSYHTPRSEPPAPPV